MGRDKGMIALCALVGRSYFLFLFSFSFLSFFFCRSSEEGVGGGKAKIYI